VTGVICAAAQGVTQFSKHGERENQYSEDPDFETTAIGRRARYCWTLSIDYNVRAHKKVARSAQEEAIISSIERNNDRLWSRNPNSLTSSPSLWKTKLLEMGHRRRSSFN